MKEKIMKIIPDEIEIDGTGIKIKEFIDLNTYVSILEDIKKNVFYNSNAEEKTILMELRYIQDVIEKCTNLKDEIVEPEEFYNPYLKDFLAKNIDNFEEVFLRIEKEYEEYMNSIKKNLNKDNLMLFILDCISVSTGSYGIGYKFNVKNLNKGAM